MNRNNTEEGETQIAENDITMQQKRERSVAAMERINGILERQKKKALANAEINQQKLKEMYQTENRKSWIHFGPKLILNVLAMVFLKADHHFMDFGKESPNQELKNMSEKLLSKISNDYADVFSLVDRITDKVKSLTKRRISAISFCVQWHPTSKVQKERSLVWAKRWVSSSAQVSGSL